MAARTIAALLFALVAGCGDDTSSTPPPDLACQCCYNSGDACSAPGASCHGFEWSCSCGSDGTWSCHGFVQHDMAHGYAD